MFGQKAIIGQRCIIGVDISPDGIDRSFYSFSTLKVLTSAMAAIAATVSQSCGTGVRIRAFDIDQAGLHALDMEAPE